MSIWTRAFWRATGERALKSVAQGAILAFGAGQLDVLHTDWQSVGGLALGAGVLSVLTSLASDALSGGTGPSLGGGEVLPEQTVVTSPPGSNATVEVSTPDED